jgi:glyoxylase-like metal-dependent hydrolase (beta-lactamase superfamily II)
MDAFSLGDLRIDRVEDVSGIEFPLDQFLVGLPPDAIERNINWLAPHHYDISNGSGLSSVHSWIVRTPRHTVLIDTCFGSHKTGVMFPPNSAGPLWIDRLAAKGLAVDDIDFVMCTHLHADHVGWNTRLVDGRWIPTFPNARYLFGRKEFEFWRTATGRWAEEFGQEHVFTESVLPCVERGIAEFVDQGFSIDDRLFVEDAPGHTPGNTLIRAASLGHTGIFSGDIVHTALQLVYPRCNSIACQNPEQARATRVRVLSNCADDGCLLLPAHFGPPHYGRVTRAGDAFKFHPGL